MKKNACIALFAYFLIPLSSNAGNVTIGGVVGRVDNISGTGNIVIQHSDGSSTYHKRGANGGQQNISRSRKNKLIKKSLSSSFKCALWVRQWDGNSLVYEKGILSGKTTKSRLLIAHIKGLMGGQKKQPFSKSILFKIDGRCRKSPNKAIASVLKAY